MNQMTQLPVLLLASVFGLAATDSKSAPADSAGVVAVHHAAPAARTTVAEWAEGAQLFDGLGSFHRAATTTSPEAQAYFDQGMRLLWAFNHDEATRSFARATQLDPNCGICFWGVSLTVGPNYNLPMMAEPRAKVAWEALQLAQTNAAKVSPVEQALIAALAARYRGPQPLDPSNEGPVLIAYANAIKEVAAKFPDDLDVQTLTAESLMNINAWKLWAADGTPTPGTEEIVARLEAVMVKDPTHPGANHYYVHATEASPHPEKAVPAAERLIGMAPAAGHLEHMPAHTFQRIGRYEDAAEANRKGAAADSAYFNRTKPPDYYVMYTAHNYQFLAFSAAMEGRRAETIVAGRNSRAAIPDEMLEAMPGADWYVGQLYAGMVRFGMWDEVLAEPAPSATLNGVTGGWRYARTIALAAKGRVDEARVEVAELEKLAVAVPEDHGAGNNRLKDVLTIAVLAGKARIAGAAGKEDQAIVLLQEAVVKEDRLAYAEPADWFIPTRHLLGVALLNTGKPQEAETVYRADLVRNPENGWALFGLAVALQAQGRDGDAAAVRQRFDKAWAHADIVLAASAF